MNKVLVTRSSMPDFEEYVNEIKELWESHWLTNMGVKHQELERKLKEILDSEYLNLLVNGHQALELGIQSMGFKKGSEVITTPFTFVSTTHAIVRNGLKPVFCDINESDYTIDVNKIEGLITEKTVAIVAVHVYGNVCDVETIEAIAKKHNLKVIYDAAHAFGVRYKNESIAKYGDAVMFSFHATKVFNTIEGGAICFKSKQYMDKLNKLKNFGIENEETIDEIGSNAKMNEFQAAMGICNLRHLRSEIEKRKKVFEAYNYSLKNISGIILPKQQEYVKTNYSYYPIVVDEKETHFTRDDLHELLKENGFFARKYFYPLINECDCYKDAFNTNDTPIAKYISERVLTLPLYADLDIENVYKICDLIKGKLS